MNTPLDVMPYERTAEYRDYMKSLFEVVENPFDWKAPSIAVLIGVSPEDIATISAFRDAVEFFTGTTPRFFKDPKGVRVEFVGYRNGPCGG